MKPQSNTRQAFTIVELLIVVAIIAVVIAIRLPVLANTKAGVQRIYCSDNLKRVGVAFRTWSGNHSSSMPMSVSRANGGAAEAVGVAATAAWFAGPPPAAVGVWGMFLVMSNELSTPKILFCPSDSAPSHGIAPVGTRGQATVFGPTAAFVQGFQNDNNVSNFVGVDAFDSRPDMFLAGDHNLGTGVNQITKTPPFTSAGTNANWATTAIGWQNNGHAMQGNVLMADGSVQNFTTSLFRAALNKTGDSGRTAGVFANAVGSTGTGINRLQFP